MNLTTKRQLPNVNNQKNRLVNSVLFNTENDIQQNFISTNSLAEKFRNQDNKRNKDVRFNDDHSRYSTLSNEHGRSKHENRKITNTKQHLTDRDANDSSKQDSIIEEVAHSHLQDIKRKLITSIYNDEDKILPTRVQSNKQRYESQLQNTKRQSEEIEIKTQQNSATLRECAKSIRENVTQFKNDLMKNEIEREKSIQRDDELSLLLNRRRRPEQDHLQLENEYLMQQQSILSKSATLNEMLSFKKELEKSERQREQLSDHLESIIKISDGKDKVVSKTLLELKEVTENCDTFERQNLKLQHDLTLALEKLEEMTEEAERFAEESLNSQKQLADSEQKREEFQIQAQETIKQWNGRVKKLEKDIDRYKLESTQMLEKHEQLIKEIETFKSQNFTLKEQISNVETDLNKANANYNRLEEQFKQNENNNIQLRTIQSSQNVEIETLKRTVNELESQLSVQRQRLSQTDKEKQNFQELLQEEIKHRNNLHSKLKQSEQDNETIHTSHSQLQHQIIELENDRMNCLQKLKEIQLEKDSLLKEKSKFILLENDYEEIKRKLETTKIDYTRGMKGLQMDYENKIEIFQLQLSDEKTQKTILQRHELEHKKEIERLQEKSAKYEDENTEQQCTIETLSRDINDKSQLINELELKINKLTIDGTNQRNEIIKKDKDYQNSLHTIYDDIIYCTECLSNDSNKPFIIEPATTPRDDIQIWLSKLKAHLAWLKQELEIRQQQENKLRQNINNALLDCETDRQYFASELAKRETIINEFTNNRQSFERDSSETINEYDKQHVLKEDPIDHRYRQLQIMIDSVKQELHTAKVQLLT